jgi:cytochrome c oxidase cbb3-type subunit 4
VNELAGHALGVLTLLLMLVFIGIWYWAWRPRHRESFDALARIPMLEAEQARALEMPELAMRDTRDDGGAKP